MYIFPIENGDFPACYVSLRYQRVIGNVPNPWVPWDRSLAGEVCPALLNVRVAIPSPMSDVATPLTSEGLIALNAVDWFRPHDFC